MSKLVTLRGLFLLGNLLGAAIIAHGQDADFKRLPLNKDNKSPIESVSQAIEVDMLSLRVQAPRNKDIVLAAPVQNRFNDSDAPHTSTARMDSIAIDLSAYMRKPIGTATKF